MPELGPCWERIMVSLKSRGLRTLCTSVLSCLFLFVCTSVYSQETTSQPTAFDPVRAQFSDLMMAAENSRTEGDFQKALELSIRAYSVANKRGYKKGALDSLIQQGFLYWNLGQMKESEEAFSRALTTAEILCRHRDI